MLSKQSDGCSKSQNELNGKEDSRQEHNKDSLQGSTNHNKEQMRTHKYINHLHKFLQHTK